MGLELKPLLKYRAIDLSSRSQFLYQVFNVHAVAPFESASLHQQVRLLFGVRCAAEYWNSKNESQNFVVTESSLLVMLMYRLLDTD
jgi:hypothetical protein